MGAEPPYLYTAYNESSRFSQASFDPKAVTRASWERKAAKSQQHGPLLSFNRHPDAHLVLAHRSHSHTPMSSRTKRAIVWLRRLQLVLRALQLNGAIGILVLMILLDNIESISAWVMRVTPGAVIIHCLYAVYHLSRDAAGRTPTSSAAYHIFSSVVDLCTMGLYAYSAVTVHQDSRHWTTRLADQDLIEYFVSAVYYALIGSGGMHLITLTFSLWLSWAFRRISLMPPDMNPLEDNLTARPRRKKNRQATASFIGDGESASSHSTDSRMKTENSYENLPSPVSVPFMHTREGSRTSVAVGGNPRNLPSRHYQIAYRNSIVDDTGTKGDSESHRPSSSVHKGSYTQIPGVESDSSYPTDDTDHALEPSRRAKFTETWAPTDSLISRTNQRYREVAPPTSSTGKQMYSALSQSYGHEDILDLHQDSDSEMDKETTREQDLSERMRPHPLRLNPPSGTRETPQRMKTPFYPLVQTQSRPTDQNALIEISNNQQSMIVGKDITDEIYPPLGNERASRRHNPVQPEIGFYSRPYGELQSATPPIIVGNSRKVSSGNDYGSRYTPGSYGRRNVSGKAAEEGRAGGNKLSRYGFGQYVGKNY